MIAPSVGVSTSVMNPGDACSITFPIEASLAGPIFTGGLIYGQVQMAEAAHDAALLAYQLAIQRAFADVDDALAGPIFHCVCHTAENAMDRSRLM